MVQLLHNNSYRISLDRAMKDLWEKIRKVNWADRRLITVVVIVILVFLMMDFNNRMTTMIRLSNEEAALQTRIANLKATQVKLEDQIAYATSEVALEEWARESNRMIQAGDHPIILLQPGDYKPQATPTPQPEVSTLDNLDIWKELLFGTSEPRP
ncbi:MAG: septum formation initiator family protein [Anaerolineaceae bacterium]|nr:septum formation initiator family protein [Anaerolineaceae bacterium]